MAANMRATLNNVPPATERLHVNAVKTFRFIQTFTLGETFTGTKTIAPANKVMQFKEERRGG